MVRRRCLGPREPRGLGFLASRLMGLDGVLPALAGELQGASRPPTVSKRVADSSSRSGSTKTCRPPTPSDRAARTSHKDYTQSRSHVVQCCSSWCQFLAGHGTSQGRRTRGGGFGGGGGHAAQGQGELGVSGRQEGIEAGKSPLCVQWILGTHCVYVQRLRVLDRRRNDATCPYTQGGTRTLRRCSLRRSAPAMHTLEAAAAGCSPCCTATGPRCYCRPSSGTRRWGTPTRPPCW